MHKSECTFDFIWEAKMSFGLIYSHFSPVNEIQEMGARVSDHSIAKPSTGSIHSSAVYLMNLNSKCLSETHKITEQRGWLPFRPRSIQTVQRAQRFVVQKWDWGVLGALKDFNCYGKILSKISPLNMGPLETFLRGTVKYLYS